MLETLGRLLPLTRYPYVGETINCPVCDHASTVGVAMLDRRFKMLPTKCCDACGLLFTNPMPTEDELTTYYTKYYRLDYQMATTEPKSKHIVKRNREATLRIAHVKDLLPSEARTLDFGCGSGEFVSHMLKNGFDSHGFEPGETYGSYAQSNLGGRIKIEAWQNVSYDKPFDLVSCFHVVEHLRDPIAALSKMVNWLSPEGLVYIEVPDMGKVNPSKGFGGLHFAHVLGFNHHNLVLAALKVGLRPKVAVSPTGIVFERGVGEDADQIASRGRELSQEIYGNGCAYRSYVNYQFGKLMNRWPSQDVA